jgi:chromosome segregation ATPase
VEALKGIDGLPAEVFDHETERTREADQKYDVANAELRKSESALEKAKYEQENASYSHQLELSKYEISVQQNELERSNQLQRQDDAVRDRAYKIATLRQQIITIDNQIAQLANIKSPYDAKVQRVKFVEQNNQDLIVDVVLAIDAADRQFPRSKDPSAQAPKPGNGDTATTTDATDSDATDQP